MEIQVYICITQSACHIMPIILIYVSVPYKIPILPRHANKHPVHISFATASNLINVMVISLLINLF